jgi:hypothetical protein
MRMHNEFDAPHLPGDWRKNEEITPLENSSGNDWVATCGVCDACFAVTAEASPENPSPSGSFCPDCQENRLKAPGVLHWRKRWVLADQ